MDGALLCDVHFTIRLHNQTSSPLASVPLPPTLAAAQRQSVLLAGPTQQPLDQSAQLLTRVATALNPLTAALESGAVAAGATASPPPDTSTSAAPSTSTAQAPPAPPPPLAVAFQLVRSHPPRQEPAGALAAAEPNPLAVSHYEHVDEADAHEHVMDAAADMATAATCPMKLRPIAFAGSLEAVFPPEVDVPQAPTSASASSSNRACVVFQN